MEKIFEKWDVYKQKCTQADGDKGSYVSKKEETGKVVSCHTSKEDAEASNRAKYASKNEEQLDEMSGMAGGAVAFGVGKEELDEMYSTAQVQSTAYSRRGLTIYIRGRKSEHEGYIERSNYQGLRNVPDST